jgi:class 3 adenylate cyclase/tetratricopeptide (TPR) repeat protein
MQALPSGTVTFLFTDIEGSTRLIEQHPDAMEGAQARHNALLKSAIDAHRGHVFQVVGDAFCSVFENPADAVSAALDAQRALHGESWGKIGAVRVRMGLHTGNAEARDGDYLSSLTVVRAQRVAAAGHGGQTLLSSAAAEKLRPSLPTGTTLRDLGAYKLRGLADAENIYQLVASDLPSEFPPLRVEDAGATSGAPLGQLVRGQLVGRGGEQQQLKAHWDQVQQARGHLVLLSGEPGVGKTRLAQELIAHVQKSGATLLRGGCYEYEATTPYLPFVEAFRDWAHRQSAAELRASLGASAGEIAKFAPEIETKLGALAPNAPLPPNEERLRLFDNVARFLRMLAAERGLLVFIDDVHWADQGTLSLLHYLLRHLRADRVLILGAYREIELDRAHPLASALVEWNRERLATRVLLGRLSLADTGSLLATLFGQESVSGEFASALYRETEGNPFFIEEVVKSLIEQGEIYREGERWQRKETPELAIPQSVKEAIGRRLNRLSEPTIDALRTAAALGKIFAFRELAATSAAGEDALLNALDEASAAQLIRAQAGVSSASDDTFAFTHDKIREVLYEELNPIRRRRLHQRIGEMLEKLHVIPDGNPANVDEPAQDLAYHFALAGDLGKSFTYAQRAARSAERVFAHDEALKFLEQARESADALHRSADVAAIDEQMGDIHEARGVIHLAVACYERALASTPAREARAALKTKAGNAYVPTGDPRGLAYLEEALVELDPITQTNALALATALVGRYYHYRADPKRAIEFLERARALAEPLGNVATLSGIYTFLAGAYQHQLLYEDSDRWARATIAIGERGNFPAAVASGNEFLAENAAGRGQWAEALAFAEKDADQGRRIGSLARVAWSAYPHSQSNHALGNLRQARTEVLASLDLCEQIGEGRLATWLDPMAAIVSADLGDDGAALMYAERGWERARQLEQVVLSAWTLHALGYSATRRSDLAGAHGWYCRCADLVRDTDNAVARNLVIAHTAESFLLAGQLDEASRLVAQALALAEFGKATHYVALARRVEAQLLGMQRSFEGALNAIELAIALFRQTGSRLELARAMYYRAALRFETGDRDAARADAVRARDEFAAMDAVRDRAMAEEMLRAL